MSISILRATICHPIFFVCLFSTLYCLPDFYCKRGLVKVLSIIVLSSLLLNRREKVTVFVFHSLIHLTPVLIFG